GIGFCCDLDDAAVAHDHACPEPGVPPKAQRDIIAGAKMFGNERFQCDIGQNIAAVNDEGFFSKNVFDIFDSAAGFEQIWLMSERNGMTVVSVLPKKIMKQVRQSVRVDDKGLNA